MTREIDAVIEQLCSNLRLLVQDMDSGSYVPRPLPIERLKNWARESYQDIYRKRILELARKLKMERPLEEGEVRLIEEWMIGDIELYSTMEDSYGEWKREVLKLSERLQSCEFAGVESDVKCLLRIQAVVIELEYVLRDIEHYRYALDRVVRFRSFVGQDMNAMPRAEKIKLADYMIAMVHSDRM